MLKGIVFLMLGVAVLYSTAAPARADLRNGGFETGDLTNWTVLAADATSVSIVSSHNNQSGMSPSSWSPAERDYFALLKTDGAFSPILMYQPFAASAGDRLTLSYFFDAGSPASNDTASGFLFGPSGLPIGLFSVSTTTPGGDMDWSPLTHIFAESGAYSLLFQVQRNGFQTANPSYLGVDAVSVVPVPTAVLLGFLGLAVAGLKLRKYV